MDPSRDAAVLEKQRRVKKSVGKKKEMESKAK